jgi:electron transfer flavoprotein alpha subunit
MARTLVIGEMFEDKVRTPTLSAAAFAGKLKELTGAPFDILIPGKGSKGAAQKIAGVGAEKVYYNESAAYEPYKAESYAPFVASVVKNGGYDVVCSAANTYGKDLMPRVAAHLEAGMASDVVDVEKQGDALVFTRPMYAGNVLGLMKITTDVKVVTVRQTEFPPAEAGGSGAAVEEAPAAGPEDAAGLVEVLSFEQTKSERPELTEAKVVVSGGRGFKTPENFKMAEDLADLMGGAVGATRAAVDAGMVSNELQVGQTGKIVAPEVYFAIGLSGAIQHLAGMKSSKVIVAINKDEEAPIFSVADYGLVADLFQAVPQLIEQIKKVKSQ